MPIDCDDQVTNETFVVLELEKSINEMTVVETPRIHSWWWDIIDVSRNAHNQNGNAKATHSHIRNQYFWPSHDHVPASDDKPLLR